MINQTPNAACEGETGASDDKSIMCHQQDILKQQVQQYIEMDSSSRYQQIIQVFEEGIDDSTEEIIFSVLNGGTGMKQHLNLLVSYITQRSELANELYHKTSILTYFVQNGYSKEIMEIMSNIDNWVKTDRTGNSTSDRLTINLHILLCQEFPNEYIQNLQKRNTEELNYISSLEYKNLGHIQTICRSSDSIPRIFLILILAGFPKDIMNIIFTAKKTNNFNIHLSGITIVLAKQIPKEYSLELKNISNIIEFMGVNEDSIIQLISSGYGGVIIELLKKMNANTLLRFRNKELKFRGMYISAKIHAYLNNYEKDTYKNLITQAYYEKIIADLPCIHFGTKGHHKSNRSSD